MKFYFEVYGCTANKADSSLIKGILQENNYEIVKNLDDADFIIILTCTVIDKTEQRMLSLLKKLKAYDKKIIVAGCMASIQKEKIIKILPNAKFLPPKYSHHIIDIIENKKITFIDKDKTFFPRKFDEVTAPIAIAEGCKFSCSYCITTHARGQLRSYSIRGIKKNIYLALKSGCKEIQLTAQDTSSYGIDKKTNLGILLMNVTQINQDFYIRVGMMNPYTCLINLNSIISSFNNKKIYKFIHLPVQSGDNQILKKMNRKYTVQDYEKIVYNFRKKYTDITIATDVIVGFPGETEKQFKNTIDLIKKIKPDITNITRFSARPNTKAKIMEGLKNTEISKQRSKFLTEICSEISFEQNKKYIGRKYKILITEIGKKNSVIGRTENYKPVVLKDNLQLGTFKNVKINDAASTHLFASLI